MTKPEFLEGLRKALSITGNQNLINNNLSFYNGYIDEEVSKGRSIENVMEELGEPRLIAKSIMQAEGYDEDALQQGAAGTQTNGSDTYTDSVNGENGDSDPNVTNDSTYYNRSPRFKRISGWKVLLTALIIILILFLIIRFIFNMITGIVGGIFSGAPLLGAILLVLFFVWLIKRITGRR